MGRSVRRRSAGVAPLLLLATLILAAACGSTHTATTVSPSTSTKVALGTNNPAQGDCTTNTSEAATSVGFAMLEVTSSSFQAEIQVQSGPPSTTYGVFMQQVPGSCPQASANGGSLVTNSSDRGQASATVPRAAGATTFYVQLVPSGFGPPDYTSDRIAAAP